MRSRHLWVPILSAALTFGSGAALAQSSDTTTPKPGDTSTTAKPSDTSTTPKPTGTWTTAKPSDTSTMPKPGDTSTMPKPSDTSTTAKPGDSTMKSGDTAKSGTGSDQNIVQLAQASLDAIGQAQQALDRGDKQAAKKALDVAETHLQPLYDTPPLKSVLNEIDEAITGMRGGGAVLKPVDLAPLMGVVNHERVYMEPEAYADLAQAEKYSRDQKLSAAAERLQRARDRITASVAYLPVQEAYLRVLAAQALIDGDRVDQAKQMLSSLPVVIEDVRVNTPMVRARFDLQAAAAAVEEKNWTRAAELLTTARTRLDGIAGVSGTASDRIRPLVDEIDRLQKQVTSESNRPKAQKIRDLAKRVKNTDLG